MSNYEKVVKAATKPKAGAIKLKYVDPIIATTFSKDSSLQHVCRALGERLRDPNSNVVFKSLIILHTMARNGEVDNVLGQMNSQNGSLRLREVAARGSNSYDGPATLNTYAQYLDERVRAYRELRHDVIRSSDTLRSNHPAASNSNRLRRLTVEKGLLREVSITQKVANALLQCSFFLDDLNDDLTMSAFRMSLKDLLALFTAINEGVINILEHYFEMAKSDAERALELYKRFCRQTEKVVAYLAGAKKAAYSLNMAIPNLKHAPVSLAGALEEYLKDPNFEQNRQEYKENKRIADGGTPLPKSESKKTVNVKESEKEKEKVVKPPTSNQAVQDFFESIDTNQGNMFSNVPTEQAFFGMQPQTTGYNPFMMGMQQQQFMQPQQTGFLQAQATGFNPFRQSVMPQATGNFGPFGVQQTGMFRQQQQQPFQAQQQPQSPFQPPQQPQSPFQKAPQSPFQSPQQSSTPKSLLSQKTGSRNPFAPPPSSTPPPLPTTTKSGPSLNELSLGAAPNGGHYSLGANAWDPTSSQQNSVAPQKTGMGDIASEFAFGRPQQEPTPAVQQQQPTIQLQQTGFGGVKPFEPTSSFGANLAKDLGVGLGAQQTGNPFARVGTPLSNGQGNSFVQNGASASSTGQPTGFNSAFQTSSDVTSPGLAAQPTGFAPGGTLPPPSTGFGGIKPFQPTSSFGQSIKQDQPNLLQF